MVIKAAIKILGTRAALICEAFALVFTLAFFIPSAGSQSAAQLAELKPAPAAAVKVDPLLVAHFNSSSISATVPVVITYKAKPSTNEFNRLQSIGIKKGFALRKLPMVIAPMSAAQLVSVQTQPGVRSIWANRIMKNFTNESRRFIGVPQLRADTEATRANHANPGMAISGKGIGIGYIDTGIDATHNDLKYGSKTVQNVIQPMSEATVGDGGLAIGVGINIFDIQEW